MKFFQALCALLAILIKCTLYGDAVKIGVSKNSHLFTDWIRDEEVAMVDLFCLSEDKSLEVLRECGGLILSGGPDIDPAYYGKANQASLCKLDTERDRREWTFAIQAIEQQIPLLGVCRGFQLLNVLFGGTLIADIPTEIDSDVTHQADDEIAYHSIAVAGGTLLSSLVDIECPFVNSNHHQAIDRLADQFLPSAWSRDGLIEALEWKEKENKPFLLGVEWHPERMTDPLSQQIAEVFIRAAKERRNVRNRLQ